DGNNGFFWRGTGQGLIGADYTITIPQIPLTLGGGGTLKLPITGDITGLTVQPFTLHGQNSPGIPLNLALTVDGDSGGTTIRINIPDTDIGFDIPIDGLPITLTIPLNSELSPILIPEINLGQIPLDLTLGSDTTQLNTALGAGIGPIAVTLFHVSPVPGFANSTSVPSSGFFNSGAGGSSGFGNTGDTLSGFWNVGSQISGFENYGGSLLSGITNLGGALSGIDNTSSLGLALAGIVSGVGNVGSQLSGLFLSGSVP
ncbi:hypothetical protein, partial [Mycobacterium gastri]|uniref:hypothetical protein n=1 Tax=Mycobacterium gastri TaxID=1777 RepID=UPI001FC8F05E